MKTRQLMLSTVCLLALAYAGCASTEASTEAPGAAEGAPATAEPTTGGEAPAAAPTTEPVPSAAAPAPAPAAEPAPAANTATQPAAAQAPAVGVVVTHKVKDYDAWKKVFDSHADARKAAGALGHGLMRDVKNDKIVTLWLPATDIEKMKAFTTSTELKDKMKEAGVVGKPTILMMKPVSMKESGKAGFAALVEVKVKDFAAFQTAFEQGATNLAAAGVTGYGLAQGIENDKVAYLYLQSDDVAKVQAYVDSKDTKKAWKDAGVIGAAKAAYTSETENVMYQ